VSVRQLVAARQIGSRPSPEVSFLGIGDPVLAGRLNDGTSLESVVLRGSVPTTRGKLSGLAELPETSPELQEVAAQFPGTATLLLREGATEANLRRQTLGRFAYLEFATHGLLREEIDGLKEAALVLTPGSKSDPFDDGLLTASEIADLGLSARLVVLSACNTAQFDFDLFKNEVNGLTSAFAFAGVPATLATLWSVDSATSRKIIGGTFRAMLGPQRMSPSRALASAQLALLREATGTPYAHPRFWAPFGVFGDGEPVEKDVTDPDRLAAPPTDVHSVASDLGTELVRLTPGIGTQGWYATGIGDKKGSAYGWLRLSFDSSDQLDWRLNDPELRAGIVLLPLQDGFIGDGSRPKTANQPNTNVVRRFDRAGQVLWEKSFSEEGRFTYVIGGARIERDAFAILTASQDTTNGAQGKQDLRLTELSLDGQVLHDIPIEGKPAGFLQGAIATTHNRVIAVLGDRFRPGGNRWVRDIYLNDRLCVFQASTRVITFDLDALSVREDRDLDGIVITDLLPLQDGRVIGVGTEFDDCQQKSNLLVLDLSNLSEPRKIYQDNSPLDTLGSTIAGVVSNRLIVLGSVLRKLDILSPELLAETLAHPGPRQQMNFATTQFEDSLLIEVSLADGKVRRSWIEAGSDVILRSGFVREGQLVLGGQVGGEAAWLILKNPGLGKSRDVPH